MIRSTLSKAFGSDTNDFTEKIKATTDKIEQLTLQSENLKKSMQNLAHPSELATKSIDKTSFSADKASGSFTDFSKAIARVLKGYIKDNEKPSGDTTCPNCHRENALIYSEGCVKCKYCELSLC